MSLLDILFPIRSLTGQEGEWVTAEEWKALQSPSLFLEKAELTRMGCPHLDRVAAAGNYETSPLLRLAIQRCKYRRIPAVGERLGVLLGPAFDALAPDASVVLCPVPLHWARKFWRGFNQAEILTEGVAELRHVSARSLLRRVRPTGHQARRNRGERRTALMDAFALRKNVTVPSHVILVDDVCTTGSTLECCAKVLKQHGVASVHALVLALG